MYVGELMPRLVPTSSLILPSQLQVGLSYSEYLGTSVDYRGEQRSFGDYSHSPQRNRSNVSLRSTTSRKKGDENFISLIRGDLSPEEAIYLQVNHFTKQHL